MGKEGRKGARHGQGIVQVVGDRRPCPSEKKNSGLFASYGKVAAGVASLMLTLRLPCDLRSDHK